VLLQITTTIPAATITMNSRVQVSNCVSSIAQQISQLFPLLESIASQLFSAFGIAQPQAASGNNNNNNNSSSNNTASTQSTNNGNSTATTNTSTTTASTGNGNNNQNNQQGQFPRSRISQLFIPIPMNRSRRVIIRRPSG